MERADDYENIELMELACVWVWFRCHMHVVTTDTCAFGKQVCVGDAPIYKQPVPRKVMSFMACVTGILF